MFGQASKPRPIPEKSKPHQLSSSVPADKPFYPHFSWVKSQGESPSYLQMTPSPPAKPFIQNEDLSEKTKTSPIVTQEGTPISPFLKNPSPIPNVLYSPIYGHRLARHALEGKEEIDDSSLCCCFKFL